MTVGTQWIHFVRHGNTTGNSEVHYWGSTDLPLSEQGREQIRKVRPVLTGRAIDVCLSSERIRALESARILLDGNGLEPTPFAFFNEVDFGDLEGLSAEQIRERHPDFWQQWQVERTATAFPGGDVFQDFHDRIQAGARQIEEQNLLGVETLIVAHRGVIRHLLGYFLNLDLAATRPLAPELGELKSLRRSANGWELSGLS